MPVAGRKAKPAGEAINRKPKKHEWFEVPNVPFKGGRKLPVRRPDGKAWPKWTKDWWAVISAMPHCKLWSDSEWRFAVETALVAAELHTGDIKAATELRNREKILGTTMDYRRALQIKYVDPPADQETDGLDAEVKRLDDYRSL